MNVLIAVDDSRFGEAAVNAVAHRPWWGDTEFKVISVVQVLVPAVNDFTPHYAEINRIQAAAKKDAHELVDRTVANLKEAIPYCDVTGVVEEGIICDQIIYTAKKWGADVIVVGSHGRKGFSRLILGSVAEMVVNRAPCSVEIIKIPAPPLPEHSKTSKVETTKLAGRS